MIAFAAYEPTEHGDGLVTFDGQAIRSFHSDFRTHNGRLYRQPFPIDGNEWAGWIEGYGDVPLFADSLLEAEQELIRQIDLLTKEETSEETARGSDRGD